MQPTPSAPPAIVTATLGFVSGRLTASANGTAVQPLVFDGNATVYGHIFRGGASSQYSVNDSSGAPLSLMNFVSDSVSETSSFDEFELVSPPTGTVTLRLAAGPTQAGLDYTLFFSNGRRLQVDVSPDVVNAGATAQVAAKILDANGSVLIGNAGTFTATVKLPDGAPQSFPLLDSGDGIPGNGIFGAPFSGTTLDGIYEVDVQGAQDVGSYQVIRMGTKNLIVSPTGATFSGPMTDEGVDTDGNGLFDMLKFVQGIAFTKNGSFKLVGDLVDAQGEVFSILPWDYDNTQSGGVTATAELFVPAAVITRHGQNGPWTLTNLRLVRKDAGSLVIATKAPHVTQAYSLSRFEGVPGPHITFVVPESGSRDGGYRVTVMGSGLKEIQKVLVDGSNADFEIRGHEALSLVIPKMMRDEEPPPSGDGDKGKTSQFVFVDIKVVTRWGEHVAHEMFRYKW